MGIVKFAIYDGTMQSLEDLVINLKLKPGEYSFDVISKVIVVHKLARRYMVGDMYEYLINERFECI